MVAARDDGKGRGILRQQRPGESGAGERTARAAQHPVAHGAAGPERRQNRNLLNELQETMHTARVEGRAATTYAARCHCGRLRASFSTHRPPAQWSVRRCACSFCRAHGALWTSDPGGLLQLPDPTGTGLLVYRFGQRTADFLLCGTCGSLVAASMETGAARLGIVNVNAFDPAISALPAPNDVEYAPETPAGRIARRQLNWTPCSQE
jgi:hypothetical protein